MRKRERDGIVYVASEECIGCKLCTYACPWGVPQWDPENAKVVKCDFCMDRIDQGLRPACATKCITNCLFFEKKEAMPETRRKQHEQVASIYPPESD
jgi:Fe-S-cluster-containing dehydrogenase component